MKKILKKSALALVIVLLQIGLSSGRAEASGGGGTPTYTIKAYAGMNGSISSPGTSSVTARYNKTYTITPNPGYRLASLFVDGLLTTPTLTYTFTSVTANHTIYATFAQNLSPNVIYGAFTARQMTINGSPYSGNPTAVAIADLNGDGKPDIVFTDDTAPGVVAVYFGTATVGDFTTASGVPSEYTVSLSAYSHPTGVAVADLNGDGIPDIVVVNENESYSVLIGNGDGSFKDIVLNNTIYPLSFVPGSVTIRDVNGDRIPDLVLSSLTGHWVAVLPGNGDGTFQAEADYSTASSAYSAGVADVNGDGKQDIVTGTWPSGTSLSVLQGNGDGTFQPYTTVSVGSLPYFIALADLNSDGAQDIVAVNSGDNTVSVCLGQGNGTFQNQVPYMTASGPLTLAIADLNADGKPDIVTTNTGSTISVLLGNGDGTFQAHTDYPSGKTYAPPAIADLNGDGVPDIAIADQGAHTITFLLNSARYIGVCGSDNGKTLAASLPTNLCSTGIPSAVTGSGHPWNWSCIADPTAPIADCSAAIQSYTVTFTPDPNGSLNGATAQSVDYGGPSSPVGAVPNNCYGFVNWTGTNGFATTGTNPLVVRSVTADMSVTANFSSAAVNGSCGTDDGQTLAASAPTNLCSSGLPSGVSGSGHPWTWSCGGVNGGSAANCSAAIRSYTLAFLSDGNGTVNGTTTQTVDYGASSSAVTAAANTGYSFYNWTEPAWGLAGTIDNPLTVTNVTADQTITANFLLSTSGYNGACGSSYGQVFLTAPSLNLCSAGIPSAVTAGPNSGWSWTCGPVNGGAGFGRATDTCYAVKYISPQVLNLTPVYGVCDSDNRQVLAATAPAKLCASGTASPVSGSGHPWTWTCTGLHGGTDANCSASIQTYTVTFVSGSGGSLSGTTSQTVDYNGSTSPETATASLGYSFLNWTGTNGFVATSTNPLVVSSVVSSQTITAHFTTAPVNGACGTDNSQTLAAASPSNLCGAGIASSVTGTGHPWTWKCSGTNGGTNASCSANIQTYTLTLASDGNGTLSGMATQPIDYGGSSSPVTAVPSNGYTFLNWMGTNGFVSTSTNPLVVSNVASSQTITANFSNAPVNGACGADGNQTLAAAAPSNLCAAGIASSVTGTGHPWTWTCSGTGGGTSAACSATIQAYTLIYSSDGSGTLSSTATQTVDYGGPSSPVTAVPSNGYTFQNWTGTNGFSTTSANPLTISNVTANHTITANFSAGAINGVCGASNGLTLTAAPASNLCAAGTASTVSGGGPWRWNCSGTNGGTSATCSAAASASTVPSGDLNNDGFVDTTDALKALRIASGLDSPSASDLARGDVAPLIGGTPHPDGKIDISDVVVILRKAIGLVNW